MVLQNVPSCTSKKCPEHGRKDKKGDREAKGARGAEELVQNGKN